MLACAVTETTLAYHLQVPGARRACDLAGPSANIVNDGPLKPGHHEMGTLLVHLVQRVPAQASKHVTSGQSSWTHSALLLSNCLEVKVQKLAVSLCKHSRTRLRVGCCKHTSSLGVWSIL